MESSLLLLTAGRVVRADSFHDAREVVGAPTVTQDQSDCHCLRVSTLRQIAQTIAEEFLDAVVDVHLLDQELQQARRPGERVRCMNCRTQGSRPNIAAPAFYRLLCRPRDTARANSLRRKLRGRDTSSIPISARWHSDPWRRQLARAFTSRPVPFPKPRRLRVSWRILRRPPASNHKNGVCDTQNVITWGSSNPRRRPDRQHREGRIAGGGRSLNRHSESVSACGPWSLAGRTLFEPIERCQLRCALLASLG